MQHQGFDGTYYLRNAEGEPVQIGDVVTDRWADSWTVDGGAAPHTSASTGKVYVTHTVENYQRTFYPSVLDLRWVKAEA